MPKTFPYPTLQDVAQAGTEVFSRLHAGTIATTPALTVNQIQGAGQFALKVGFGDPDSDAPVVGKIQTKSDVQQAAGEGFGLGSPTGSGVLRSGKKREALMGLDEAGALCKLVADTGAIPATGPASAFTEALRAIFSAAAMQLPEPARTLMLQLIDKWF
jgi:hypothetical protein